MSKNEYMAKLEKKLKHLPKSDRRVALEYYEEYFEEAGVENEQNVIEELGSPEQVAKQIVQELAVKKMEEEPSSHMGMSLIWIIILALFAAPIGLPFTIILIAAMFCVFTVLLILLLFFFISSVLLSLSGVVSFIVGIILLFSQPANGIAITGLSFILFGCGILWFYCNCIIMQFFWRNIRRLLKKAVKRGENPNEREKN